MKRWKCSTCGSGVNAPSKPRRNDIRRYCLECSVATGFLVERICPALEKERQIRSVALQATRVKAKQREKQTDLEKHSINGIDYRDVLKRAVHLPCFTKTQTKSLSKITITIRRNKYPQGVGGRAFYDRILIANSTWWGSDSTDTLLHELAHCCEYRWSRYQPGHGKEFRKWYNRLIASWNKTYPIESVTPDSRWDDN